MIAYQMPKGVEHAYMLIGYAPGETVIAYQMPKGVEHIITHAKKGRNGAGDCLSDAERR